MYCLYYMYPLRKEGGGREHWSITCPGGFMHSHALLWMIRGLFSVFILALARGGRGEGEGAGEENSGPAGEYD